jgi:ribonuclease III
MNQACERPPLEELEAIAGVSFRDRPLLVTALTHRSYLNEVDEPGGSDNERLEFLGDALMDFVAGDFLFRRMPDATEGTLTALRSALVCEAATARYARELDLGRYLRLGRGEAVSGGRDRVALLGDTYEALVGAVLLDQGLEAARQFVLRFIQPELEAVMAGQRGRDSRGRFQELAQDRWQVTPHYATIAERGPDHAKRFRVQVSVGDDVWGIGEGHSKASAARRAASAALARIEAMERDSPTPSGCTGEPVEMRAPD